MASKKCQVGFKTSKKKKQNFEKEKRKQERKKEKRGKEYQFGNSLYPHYFTFMFKFSVWYLLGYKYWTKERAVILLTSHSFHSRHVNMLQKHTYRIQLELNSHPSSVPSVQLLFNNKIDCQLIYTNFNIKIIFWQSRHTEDGTVYLRRCSKWWLSMFRNALCIVLKRSEILLLKS